MQAKRILNGTNARAGARAKALETPARAKRTFAAATPGLAWSRWTEDAALAACDRVLGAYERARGAR